ncbi:hypothetical protein AB0C29_16770 [Actinoplanes sp. NPDC048791]|uniref:phosphotriesterase family protein n=1 Tax=Actinoplanes sp. NPDC048791 TaxID=3154623 RepID=UPI0033E29F8F
MTTWQPRTVLGAALGTRYDIVLTHEHFFVDLRCWLSQDDPLFPALEQEKVSDTTLADVRRNPFACPDNLVLDDADLIASELRHLTAVAPSPLVIDVTPDTIGRDPARVAALSRLTGVDIIIGCGRYIDASWTGTRRLDSVDRLADEIVGALTDDRHPAGVIGEIGTSSPITELEKRALAAAATAQGATGALIFVHLHPWMPAATAALDILERHGADPSRIVLCHLDVNAASDVRPLITLLRRGCSIGFDIWGDEFPYGDDPMPTDRERLRALVQLAEAGLDRRVLHSQDVCTRTQLHRFGGRGYDHLARHLPGWLRAEGFTEQQIAEHMAGNALRVLGQN